MPISSRQESRPLTSLVTTQKSAAHIKAQRREPLLFTATIAITD